MAKANVLTAKQLVKQFPRLLKDMPHILQGLKLTRLENPSLPVGLGLTLEEATLANPKGVAILYEDLRITYLSFNRWVNRIAHYLRTQGIKKGDVIGICLENRPELLAYSAAIVKLGAIAAMLNTNQKSDALSYSIKLVSPKFIILGEELEETFLEIQADIGIEKNRVAYLRNENTLDQTNTVPPGYINIAREIQEFPNYNPDTTKKIYKHDTCFYIFTSGTTGLHKAGKFTHCRWMKVFGGMGKIALKLNKKDILYCTLPLYHATALCVCWGSVISGCAGFAIRRKFSASNFWQDTKKYHATTIAYIGELCRYLMAQPPTADDSDNPVIKMLGNGLRPNIWKPFKDRFGIEEVYEFYGASDGNVGFSNIFNLDNTVGFSPNDYAIVRFDRDTHQPIRNEQGFVEPVPKGKVGLLISQINDRFPLDGYTDRKQTDQVILKNAFESGDRWFNTGDLLRDLGFRHAQFVDRLGDTYRWKGENVSTTEVENSILNFPSIDQAAVYGVQIGELEGRAGMATITLKPGEKFDPKAFAEYLTDKIASFAIPLFIRINDSLKTTSTFKYKKVELREQGFNPNEISEPLYLLDDKEKVYQPLSKTVYKALIEGKISL